MNTKRLLVLTGLVLAVLLTAGCGGQAAEPVAVAPTAAPPTETAIPPTDTPVPPTETPVPPTETPMPPTPEPTATKFIKIFPPKQGYVTLVDDSESKLMVMFGGQTGPCCSEATISDRTWIFDATSSLWTLMPRAPEPSGPGPSAGALAYDSESDRVIMFGSGIYPDILNDTWAYDTNTDTWTEMSAEGPTDPLGARLAYDAESDRIILFVGQYYDYGVPDDTWAYDYNTDTWTDMKPDASPPGRNFHGMTYDAESDRVLIWGSIEDGLPPFDASVWAYDYNTNTWEQMPLVDPHPENRIYPALAYDAESDRTILYGGFAQSDQTWAYDYNTNTWTKMNPATTPQKVSRHALAYSAAADRVILSGGQVGVTNFNYTRDTWSYDYNNDTWTFIGP